VITRYFGALVQPGSNPDVGLKPTEVTVEHPSNVVPDGRGGNYVGSSGYSAIYDVGADGIIESFLVGDPSGSGAGGLRGDGGPALGALYGGSPAGSFAADSAGDIYITDVGNDRDSEDHYVSANALAEHFNETTSWDRQQRADWAASSSLGRNIRR
jgi:hypothetical protein